MTITITSKRGIDSTVLSEQLANFLHTKGLTVELARKPFLTKQQPPQAVIIRTCAAQGSKRQWEKA